MKPCHHPDIEPGQPYSGGCRLCWLWANSPEHRKVWEEGPAPGFGAPAPEGGPGSELKALLASLGLLDCSACQAWAYQMDTWGADGCHLHREEILARLKGEQARLGWAASIRTSVRAAVLHPALALALARGDPASVLLDEALARARKKHLGTLYAEAGVRRVFDEHTLFPDVPGKRFNPALLALGDGYLFAFRNGWAGSDIYLCRLGRDFAPLGGPWKLDLAHDEASYGREDPRLFLFGGRAHVAFIGVAGEASICHTSQLYARLGEDLAVEEVFYPRYPERQLWEKNWQFFEHDGELYAIYSVMPHRVLRIRGAAAELVYETPAPPGWSWGGGPVRGGASPVRVGDELWCFVHDRVEEHGLRVYRAGLYTFLAHPPFPVSRFTPAPLLAANKRTRPPDQYACVIWPGGAVHEGGRWVLACGDHDRWSTIRALDHADLEAQLVEARMPPHWACRPQTDDAGVYDSVCRHNEYRLPARFAPNDVVVDIGAHTGAFAHAALRRGAGRALCVEPAPENLALLRHNLAPWGGKVEILTFAAWRCDRPPGPLSIARPGADPTGGRVAARPGDVPVWARPFDSILDGIPGRVRFLKLDCEGAEFAILLTSRLLDRIDEIAGEYHLWPYPAGYEGLPGPSVEALKDALESAGFAARIDQRASQLGLFWARRD